MTMTYRVNGQPFQDPENPLWSRTYPVNGSENLYTESLRDVTRPQPHEAEAEAEAEATTHEAEAEAEATTHEAEAEAEATTHEAEAEAEAKTHL